MSLKKLLVLLICLVVPSALLAGELYNRTPYDVNIPSGIGESDLIHLTCDVTGKVAKAGQTVKYNIQVQNISEDTQKVRLSLEQQDWTLLSYEIEPEEVVLDDNESKTCVVRFTISPELPRGGWESRTLIAVPESNKCKSEQLELITSRKLEHPYMFVDKQLIEDMKTKVKKYEWAQKNFEQMKKFASNWQPPKPRRMKITRKGVTWYGLYPSYTTEQLWKVALVWKITDEKKYRRKVVDFMKSVADPEKGYRTTRWATNSDAYVHEGEFFTFYAAVYDLIYNDPALSVEDHKNIEETIRLFIETSKSWHIEGDIGNWVIMGNVASICSGAVLQDVSVIKEFINYEKGFKEQISLGVMGDGWWFEGASNYSYLCARYYGYAAKSIKNLGFNLFDRYVPAGHLTAENGRWKNGWLSMNFDVWGPPGAAHRCLKDLYDGAIPFMYENGYVVANNDSEPKKPGDVYELAYYHYRDSDYLWVLDKAERTGWQSLVYGIGEIPDNITDPRSSSSHADNIGIAALRSQKPSQTPDEQIQAFLKWGTHGGWHGHFDRASLLTLRRYGIDFLLPRPAWFGYGRQSYKAWVQPSISHNMVIVDKYQQEPVESKLLSFYAGSDIQVSAVETNARWAQKQPWDIESPGDLDPTNIDKMVDYGNAEPVLQRRMMIVTDDYVILSDYLEGNRSHTFDWLLHPAGYKGTSADKIELEKHTARISNNPHSSYYYITDCSWYDVSGKVLNKFQEGGARLNVHNIIEDDMTMAVGTYPYAQGTFSYSVVADGEKVKEQKKFFDSSKVHTIDVNCTNVDKLRIVFDAKKGGRRTLDRGIQAVGNPRVILENGTVKSLLDIGYELSGTKPAEPSKDYRGEAITIAGKEYEKGLMVEPAKDKGELKVDLSNLDAERFICDYGGDRVESFDSSRRNTLMFRTEGKKFKFVSLLEPYKGSPLVDSLECRANGVITVYLNDGRTHKIKIEGLDNPDGKPSVQFKEFRNGDLLKNENSEKN